LLKQQHISPKIGVSTVYATPRMSRCRSFSSTRAMGLEKLALHDMRRTCAKLCRKRGGDLEQIKILLGHASIQTTERGSGAGLHLCR
jgi:integrase